MRKPGIPAQSGFGLLETITGLVVFALVAVVGLRAYHGVVANQKEAAQVKALTDAVTVTAERLSTMTVAALTTPGSAYLQWSAPQVLGSAEYAFRYRTFASPSIGGGPDTSVVGLEVEIGLAAQTRFETARQFATLIAPHLSSRDALGAVSTRGERDAEASFYSGLQARIKDNNGLAVNANQIRLNSFNCYDKGQCCDFMRKYFADPTLNPDDGMNQKCLYRCALGGGVPMEDWKHACSVDFCDVAPWKTKSQCCAAIAAGECKPGSVCAQVCVECVGEDGSHCAPPACKDHYFNDFFNCATGTMCNGQPIPDGDFPGWGNVKDLCKQEVCATMHTDCGYRLWSCCLDYWGPVNRGETPDPRMEVCATISTREQCCNYNLQVRDWDIKCSNDGKVSYAIYEKNGKSYCGWGPGWDRTCAFAKGCSGTYTPLPKNSTEGGGGDACVAWTGRDLGDPWADPNPPQPQPQPQNPPKADADKPAEPDKAKTKTDNIPVIRIPSTRGGSDWSNSGGRE